MELSGDGDRQVILRTLLRSRWDPECAAWIDHDLRTADIDWDALLDAAQRARVAPLIYLLLREKAWLPYRVRDRLRTFYFGTARRNLLAFNALALVIDTLNAHDIPNILLKGVALALTLYKNEALRPMGDVDLLVHWADVPGALDLLRDLGYSTPIPEMRPGAWLAYNGELYVRSGDQNVAPMDLHWNLTNAPVYRRPTSEQWLWDSAQPVAVGATEGRVLCPEAQFLHLCAHKVLHHSDADAAFATLWGYDIALLLAKQPLDWDIVLARAQDLGMVAPLQRAVPALMQDWGVAVPEDVLNRLQALHPSRAERRMMRWRASSHKKIGIWAMWTNVWAMPDLLAGARYVWDMAFPSITYMRDHYGMPHVALLPVYYVRRWLRGVGIALG